MSEILKTVKVQPWSVNQGDFVEINESDFDANRHKLYTGKTPTAPPPAAKVIAPPPVEDGIKWASNAARNKAIASGLDFSKVKGTGNDGKITAADVEAAIEAAKPGVNFASDEAGELAADLGFDAESLKDVKGTGNDGAITVEDLQKLVDKAE